MSDRIQRYEIHHTPYVVVFCEKYKLWYLKARYKDKSGNISELIQAVFRDEPQALAFVEQWRNMKYSLTENDRRGELRLNEDTLAPCM